MPRAGIDSRPYIEIYDGEARLKMPPSLYHSLVQPRLGRIMGDCAGERGYVLTELHVRVGAVDGMDTLYLPDVCYISSEQRLLMPMPNSIPDFTPEIVAEIRSPKKSGPALQRKIARYLTCGALLVLDVDAEAREIVAHRASGEAEGFSVADEFVDPLFPWSRFNVSEVFIDRDRFSQLLAT